MTLEPHDEERLAALLKTLPPAPEGWVQRSPGAAARPPGDRRDRPRAEADAEFRAAVTADLEAALEQAGYDVDPSLLPELRERLSAS